MNSVFGRKSQKVEIIPRIDIERTVTNDIQYILNSLLPTIDVANFIKNFESFLAEHHAEIRLIYQIINNTNGHYAETTEQIKVELNVEDMENKNSPKVVWLCDNGSLLR